MNTLLRNLALGALAGSAGTAAMNTYWRVVTRVAGHDPRMLTRSGDHALDEVDVAGRQTEEGEASTAAIGRHAYEAATGDEPDEATRERLSSAVHWSYGASMGALYAVVRAGRGGRDLGGGLALGTGLWAVGDELAVPLLGLSKGPTAYPPEQHAHRLGAHLVYGVTTALVTQALAGAVDRVARPKHPLLRLGLKAGRTYLKWKAVGKATRFAGRKVLG